LIYADVTILITQQYLLSNREQQTNDNNNIKGKLKVNSFFLLAYDAVSMENRFLTFLRRSSDFVLRGTYISTYDNKAIQSSKRRDLVTQCHNVIFRTDSSDTQLQKPAKLPYVEGCYCLHPKACPTFYVFYFKLFSLF
jgi:hypothetical protein